jgi:hypothetical protein
MVNPSPSENLIAIISALLYGVLFSFVSDFVRLFFDLIVIFISAIKTKEEMLKKDKNEPKARINAKQITPVITAFKILFFGLGFSVISYITLDGNLRLYILISSIIGWYLTDRFIFSKLHVNILVFAENTAEFCKNLLKKLCLRFKKMSFFKKSQKNAVINDHRPP